MSVQYAVPRRGVPGPASLKKWCGTLSRGMRVTLRIVGRREARRLNATYRERDRATNVLAFPYGRHEGDLVLCHPVIAREARAQGKPLDAHYAHLVVHGMLHLRGHDHETKREALRMERAEIRTLARLGYADPYAVESIAPHERPSAT